MLTYLHTMIRVVDLEQSIRFYTEGLGFVLETRKDYPEGRFTLAFLRAPGDRDKPGRSPMIELTHNWDTKEYSRGDAYGHMAFQVESIEAVQKHLQSKGYDLSWGPGLTPDGKTSMAFADDPDGYEIELLQYSK
jgi:lactoylglutathione lyase